MDIIHQPLDNIGGNHRSIWILPAKEAPAFIQVSNLNIINTPLNLSSWNRIDFTFDSLSFEETPVTVDGEDGFLKMLEGMLPKDRVEVTRILYKYRNSMVVVVFMDRNGSKRLVGNKQRPALLRYSSGNGPKAADANMYNVTIQQADRDPAPYYSME